MNKPLLGQTRCRRNRWKRVYVSCLIFMLFAAIIVYAELPAASSDYPHNEGSNAISCSACHINEAPQWATAAPGDELCLACHTGGRAPYEKTHSSLTTSGKYGAWSVACVTCHDPHEQRQMRAYGAESYLFWSASTAVSSGADYSTITMAGAGWTDHQWQGMLVIGNAASPSPVFYKILDNTADTLIVKGSLTGVAAGNTFAILYGGLIDDTIYYTKTNVTPNVQISVPVKLFRNAGANSYQGMCTVCHSETLYHRSNGSGAVHYPDSDCISCHSHEAGFKAAAASDNDSGDGANGAGGGKLGANNLTVLNETTSLKALNAPTASYNPATKKCTGVYCHSNGADGANLAYKETPAWDGSFGANKCGSCHDNPPQYEGQSHYTASGFMGKEGGHLVGIHFDNIYDGSGGLLVAGATDPSSHGDPNTSTTMTCYLCHNGVVSSTAIDTYALHNLGSSAMKCSTCHTTPQSGAITNKSLHVNGMKNVAIANVTVKSKAQLTNAPDSWTRTGTYKTAGSHDSALIHQGDWNPGAKTCTTACHNNQPVTWGSTTVTCVSCHTSL
jgi:predicted CxxxxCH...CXXCH cytochrome family protein